MSTIKELLARASEEQHNKGYNVRVEVRGKERNHVFDSLWKAQKFWDDAHKYGMNIDPRPE